jgi:hypothetical protein
MLWALEDEHDLISKAVSGAKLAIEAELLPVLHGQDD